MLVDVMGDDLRVVNAARVSFAKESEWEEQPGFDEHGYFLEDALSEKDQKLINYLAKHGHWTPFSHVQITMREKVPLFVARQRFKHTVGFTYNERSGRYVGRDVDFFTPTSWRKQAKDKKQGSSDEVIVYLKEDPFWHIHGGEVTSINDLYKEFVDLSETLYNALVSSGVSIEQARMVLPQSMYTEYYVTGSLAAWGRAYSLRSAPDAQMEIRELANQWNTIISGISELKHSWHALTS